MNLLAICQPNQALVILCWGHRLLKGGSTLLVTLPEEVRELARLTLESNLRGVLATPSPEQVNADTEAFARSLMEEAVDDFGQLGLELDNLQITALRDGVDDVDTLGRPQQLALLRQAVPPLAVEELRLIGDGDGGSSSLPVLLARLQAATDLDLGRWLRGAAQPQGDGG